jgi:uncharacterized protein YjbI with pentapeptide repeats
MSSNSAPPQLHHRAEWHAYWASHGQPWRRELPIEPSRQDYLASLRARTADVRQLHFPFKDVRLSRADIEWLLATHEEQGPVDWDDPTQHERVGLDLSGAILSKVDLRGLPLARLRSGIGSLYSATDEQREAATVHLDGANLMEALLEGADLRYAHLERTNLSGAHLNEADLSFAHLQGAQLVGAQLKGATLYAANLYRANLGGAQLELANLGHANLRQADFQRAQLQEAELRHARMEQTILIGAHLERADLSHALLPNAVLSQAHLGRANLTEAHLEGAILSEAYLGRANLWRAHLIGTVLFAADLERANLSESQLDGAVMGEAKFHGAALMQASLRGADLRGAHLEGADLRCARLEGATLWTETASGEPRPPSALGPRGNAYWTVSTDGKIAPTEDLQLIWRSLDHFPPDLPPADLRLAFLDHGTRLDGITLADPVHGSIRAADIHWGGANLSVIDWSVTKRVGLGDVGVARQRRRATGKAKSHGERLQEYEAAIRANRQLAIALLDEGLDEAAVTFSSRAQALEEVALWQQGQYPELLASLLLNRIADLLAGYGYKPIRSIASYLVVVFTFAVAYWLLGPQEGYHYTFWGWLVLSVTSFHGRGFFPAPIDLEQITTRLQAGEAVVGLFVEVSLIAIYTKRFFHGK